MFAHVKSYQMNKNQNEPFECYTDPTYFEKIVNDISSPPAKPKKSKRLRAGFIQIYHEYCANTSIHGVQYLGDRRPLKEKFFWLCVFIISIYCCAILIKDVYIKWHETPVIVSFSEKSTPVWNIPFPAVTICSETKRVPNKNGSSFGKLYAQFVEDQKASRPFRPANVSVSEMTEFRTLLHICNTHIIDEGVQSIAGEEINYFDALDSMLPPFERYFFFCRWLNHFNECDKYFWKTYTEEGICYTFNGLKATDIYRNDTYQYQRMKSEQVWNNETTLWSLETGYHPDSGVNTYPARVLSAGSRAGIFIALQSFKQEVDYACRGPVQGFKVLLHSPEDVPHVSQQFVRIPMTKEVLIAVKPNMITTSAGIAEYHPTRRQCFLTHERHLRFFKTYTQTNCELECLANFTLDKCGCVKFSMPRTLDMPVCGENKIHCYDRAEDDLLIREFQQGLKLESSDGEISEKACNCMPACTSLVYNAEISQGNFDLQQMLDASEDTEFMENYPGSEMSRLSIYFKENQFITSKRSELYGVTDFLGNCGGIFGLFMGFSMLSLVEAIYHFTLRFWSNMKHMIKVPQ